MSEARYCRECGAALVADAAFCGSCGARVDEQAASAAQPARPETASGRSETGPPTRARPGLPLMLVGGGSVLAVVAVLFSGLLTQEKQAALPVSAGSGTKQTQTDGAKPSIEPTAKPQSSAATAEPSAGLAWTPYVNSRYGVTVDYPSRLFVAKEAPPDNSGRSFEGDDGSWFYVYSSANALEQTIDELLAETSNGLPDDAVINRQVSASSFTLVMRRDQDIVHRHLMTSEGGSMLHWLEIGYPETREAQYSAAVDQMLASFRMAPGSAPPPESGAAKSPDAAPGKIANPAADGVIDIPLIGWVHNPASADFADLPALVAEADYSPDVEMGQLAFVCQPGAVSEEYYALLVAPFFTVEPSNKVRLAIEGAGAGGELSMVMRDLYATADGERPNINWDATILFAPIEMEDLGQFLQADALRVMAGGQNWRLAGGNSLARAGDSFLAACAGNAPMAGGSYPQEHGPDEFSYQRIESAEFGFEVAGRPIGFSVDIPEYWVRVPNTLEHELIFASPDDDPDAQMFLALRAEPAQGQSAAEALAGQVGEMQSMAETEILEHGSVETASGPAVRVLLRFFSPSESPVKLMDEIVVLQVRDLTYRIELTVPEPVWHTGRQVMQRALETLELRK